MKKLCVRTPEFLGCYNLPYEVNSSKEEIRFEGGLFKMFVRVANGSEQKRIYRPLA
jgi:hypothetical protein